MTAIELIKKNEGRSYRFEGLYGYHKETEAARAEWRQRGPDFDFEGIRKKPTYKDAQDSIIELTMSCSHPERVHWMEYFMDMAHAFCCHGSAQELELWDMIYLAAFDLWKLMQ